MALKGGYQMIDLQGTAFTLGNAQTISGIYEKLEGGYAKPILLTGLNIRNVERRDAWCNFNVEGTTFVASFDDVTVAITDDDEVTFTARSYYLEDIVDSEGRQRFIEGDGQVNAKITNSYCKWSLSGTHLLLVLGGSIADGQTLGNGETLSSYVIPEWIYTKIVPLFSTSVERQSVNLWEADYTATGVLMWLQKAGSNTLKITSGAPYTIEDDKTFRVEYDLLIDTEE